MQRTRKIIMTALVVASLSFVSLGCKSKNGEHPHGSDHPSNPDHPKGTQPSDHPTGEHHK